MLPIARVNYILPMFFRFRIALPTEDALYAFLYRYFADNLAFKTLPRNLKCTISTIIWMYLYKMLSSIYAIMIE